MQLSTLSGGIAPVDNFVEFPWGSRGKAWYIYPVAEGLQQYPDKLLFIVN